MKGIDMRKALVLVNPYFPYGDAISSRMLNFCRLLRDADWDVHVLTGHTMTSNAKVGETYNIEGITYQYTTERRLSSVDSFIADHSFVKALKQYLKENSVDAIFMNVSCELFMKVLKISKKYSIDLFVEQCEWLDVSIYKFRKADIRLWRTQRLRKKGFLLATGIVSISTFLNNYYVAAGAKTICVPTILDVKNTCFQHEVDYSGKIHLVFTGSIGGSKELLKPVLEALNEKEGYYRDRITIDIYGPSRRQIIENVGDEELLQKCAGSVQLHGRIPQEEVSRVLATSHFLVFLRPQRRSSNAGFPTKLAESMAVGTPVITNDTSDIALYLRNKENGYLLTGNSKDDVIRCFDQLILLDPDEYKLMRKHARSTAELSFDYRCYCKQVSDFFNGNNDTVIRE